MTEREFVQRTAADLMSAAISNEDENTRTGSDLVSWAIKRAQDLAEELDIQDYWFDED